MRRRYIKPSINIIAKYGSCLMLDAHSGNIIEQETDEIQVFPDGETVSLEEALGKQHYSVWDDWDDMED